MMEKSLSVSSEGSWTVSEDDVDSVCSDELLGSQSRRWLTDLRAQEMPVGNAQVLTVGRDGLFVDYHFPLGDSEMQDEVVWKRPKEICTTSPPEFIVNGATRLDIIQGKLSDCWLLSAIASLSIHHFLLKRVVPTGQSFQEGYNGSFIFRFWQYGQWKEVKIDDLLPTKGNKLMYLSSPVRHEFWSSLLEKAYAKLKGGYTALDMGLPHEAMVDMTGGVTEVISTPSVRNLPLFLKHHLAKGALINCANGQGPLEGKTELGIMFRHAYALTAVKKVQTAHGTQDLVRLLNPWGGKEWKGPWSDFKGPEWNEVSLEEQQRVGKVSREDGEFWMSISDFRQNFEMMEVCHLTDGHFEPGSNMLPWHCIKYHGTWVPRVSAGGPPGASFSQNPQFSVTLSQVDSDTDSDSEEKTCSFILALMQKHQRRRGVDLYIALHIYPGHPDNTPLSADELKASKPVLCSGKPSPRREVVLRGSLPPGHYNIIPSTSEPNQEGAFLLRVLMEQGNAAVPANRPPQDVASTEVTFPHLAALPCLESTRQLFKKHRNKRGLCTPVHLYDLLTEALQGGVLACSAKYLTLEHCKSLVVLIDSHGMAELNWQEFKSLWDKIRRWTDIFLVFDKNRTARLEYEEIKPALKAAGIKVDDLIIRLAGLRYTEPDLTISYPGFLYLLLKLETMIHNFYAYDMAGVGSITIGFKQWLHMTMYN